jgi:hypothetical protein
MSRIHPCDAFIQVSPPPPTDIASATADGFLNAVVGFSVGQHEDHPRATSLIRPAISPPYPPFEDLPIPNRQLHRNFGTHVA